MDEMCAFSLTFDVSHIKKLNLAEMNKDLSN